MTYIEMNCNEELKSRTDLFMCLYTFSILGTLYLKGSLLYEVKTPCNYVKDGEQDKIPYPNSKLAKKKKRALSKLVLEVMR